MRNRIPRALSLLLAFMMVFGIIAPGLSGTIYAVNADAVIENSVSEFSDYQLKAFETVSRSTRPSGLIGFDDQYVLPADGQNGSVSVIVEFKCQPAIMQQVEAQMFGVEAPNFSEAAQMADDAHRLFRQELDELFGIESQDTAFRAANYHISAEYTDAINGVALTLPANMVEKLAELETVWAVYPDAIITAESVVYSSNSGLPGLAESRELLDIETLHNNGVKGKGVVVGVLDTGVDYTHPDLADAFGNTIKPGSDLEPIDGKYYGRNFVEDIEGVAPRRFNDPMETTYAEWYSVRDSLPEFNGPHAFYSSHGTHVAGTIAARGVNKPIATLGIAPEATLLAYRVLGAYGAGMSSWLLSALDKVYQDGCTVLNASLGVDLNDPRYASSIASNNLILQHDIVFAIAGGNSGPNIATVGSPGTSALAITVGNGTTASVTEKLKVTAKDKSIDVSIMFNNYDASFVKAESGDGYIVKNPHLYPDDSKTDGAYRLVPLWCVDSAKPLPIELPADAVSRQEEPRQELSPIDEILPDREAAPAEEALPGQDVNPVDESIPEENEIPGEEGPVVAELLSDLDEAQTAEVSSEQDEDLAQDQPLLPQEEGKDEADPYDNQARLQIGNGTRTEFEAQKDDIRGNVIVVNRGQMFFDTLDLAAEYGARAIIVINNDGDVIGFQGEKPNAVPIMLTMTPQDGLDFVYDALANNGASMSFTDYEQIFTEGKTLADSSSRGPVNNTAAIKPDIVAPGTYILAPVPFFITTSGSKTEVDQNSHSFAYQRMTGTSMASPHIAGIAALLRGYNSDWTASEIKARIMNTASMMNGEYSVHEVGAGYVNPVAAVYAQAYVTAECRNIFLPDNRPAAIAETGSFSFNGIYLDQPMEQISTLEAHITNCSGSNKEFAISVEKNHTGFLKTKQSHLIATAEMWRESGGTLVVPEGNILVDANGKTEFSLSFKVPANTDKKYAGIYEGTVVLTNVNDNGEVYRLPFTITLRNQVAIGPTFISHPVINTDGVSITYIDGYYHFSIDSSVTHIRNSCFANIVTTVYDSIESISFGVAKPDIENISDTTQWIGILPASINKNYIIPGQIQFRENQMLPVYWESVNGSTTGELLKFEAGHYKVIACYDSGFGVTYHAMDLFVDSDLPKLDIADMKDDICYYTGSDVSSVTMTGNIYDDGLAEMAKKDIRFLMYDEEADVHSPVPDQALNAIFARIAGSRDEFIRADIKPNGDFTLSLTGLSQTGITDIELYYFDSFAASVISEGMVSDSFHPDLPSYANVYGPPYSFYGVNKGHKIITLTHTGPYMVLDKKDITVDVGDSFKLNATFNADAVLAGYNAVANYKTSDANIATVSADGTVTATGWGTATITAVSNVPKGQAPLEATMTIRVTGINDGVELPAGAQLWFGRYEYVDFDVHNPIGGKPEDFSAAISDAPYESHNGVDPYRPMHWRIMGEEAQNGKGDRYVTILSSAAIEVKPYNDSGWVPYGESDLNKFLNGEFVDNAFTASEKETIPSYQVTVGRYDKNGNSIGQTILDGQKVYIPWGIDNRSSAKYANTVFWTAGDEASFEYSLRGGSAVKNLFSYRNPQEKWLATYYLRTQDETQDKQKVVEGCRDGGSVETRDNLDFFAKGLNWNEQLKMYSAANFGVGVVPVTKLDKSRIVFAYTLLKGSPDQTDGGFGWNQQFMSGQDTYQSYRLAILGGNNGHDIGTLSNVPNENQHIEEGQKVLLPNVRASVDGQDYSIAYKVVGEAKGIRTIVDCDVFEASTAGQDLSLHTGKLDAGEYKVYIWLQKDSDYSSCETGVVESFKLIINEVEFTDGANDGVDLPIGSYVYYGSYRHAMEAGNDVNELGLPVDSPVTSREDVPTPILWQVTGEELDENNVGDGYTTIMSRYVLDRWVYSPNTNPLMDYGFDYYECQIEYEIAHTFSNSFTKAEYNQIPFTTVVRCDYFLDMPTIPIVPAERQKVYLPWTTRSFVDGDDHDPIFSSLRSVFWSAGYLPLESNALEWKYNAKTGPIPESVKGMYKNGNPSGYWAGNTFTCLAEYMLASGNLHMKGAHMYYTPSYHGGLRPVTKLDPRGIIYAAEIGSDKAIKPDGTNYLAPGQGEAYYKLTIQGEKGGKNIGTLNNIAENPVNIATGNNAVIKDITSSAYGSNYSIAYKIVGGSTDDRQIVRYGELATSAAAQSLTLDTGKLQSGSYKLYIWLQKNNDAASNEAGVVYTVPLNIGDTEYTVEYRLNDAQGELLYSYTSMCTAGDKVTAETKAFDGYREKAGQTKTITAVRGGKNLIVVLYDKLASYTVEYRISSRTGVLLDSYSGEDIVGAKITAADKAFDGFKEIGGQTKEMTLADGNNILTVLYVKRTGGVTPEPGPVRPTPGTTPGKEEQIPTEPPALAGGDILFETNAGSSDAVVYYYGPSGSKVYVAFSVVIGDKIYYKGNSATKYYVEPNNKQFADIEGSWAKNDILFVARRGIITGMTETEYQPQGTLTRAMLAAVLARMADADISGYSETGFADSNGAWYTPYIAWAADKGIITGYSDGTFRPNRAVSREEIAVMAVRFIDSMNIGLDKKTPAGQFADQDQIQGWASAAVQRMRQYGILSGRGDNRFDPRANATRAETAKIIRVLVESAMAHMVENSTATSY